MTALAPWRRPGREAASDGAAAHEGPSAAAALGNAQLVTSSLGLRTPLLFALKRLAWVDHFYHLTAPLSRLRFPRVRSDLLVTEATEADFDEMARGLPALERAVRKDVVTRLLFHRHGFTGCYVARTAAGELAGMHWLLRPRDDATLQASYPRLFYPIREHEVMFENGFVYPRFRGTFVLPTINQHAIALARAEGARLCSTYIRKDNLASLNATLAMGFQLHRLLTSYNLAGISWRNL